MRRAGRVSTRGGRPSGLGTGSASVRRPSHRGLVRIYVRIFVRNLVRLPVTGLLAVALLVSGTGCSGGDPGEGEAAVAASSHPLAEAYLQVAFGNRRGVAPLELRKWSGPLAVRVTGSPRYEDRIHLRRTVETLNAVPGVVDIVLREWAEPATTAPDRATPPARVVGTVEVAYLPMDRFAERAAGWDGSQASHVACRSGAAGALDGGLILLPMDDQYPQYMRDDLLLEGLVACLGLAGGLDRPHESVFQKGPNWNEAVLTRIDLDLLELHYRPELPAGIARAEAARRLGLEAEGASGAPRSRAEAGSSHAAATTGSASTEG